MNGPTPLAQGKILDWGIAFGGAHHRPLYILHMQATIWHIRCDTYVFSPMDLPNECEDVQSLPSTFWSNPVGFSTCYRITASRTGQVYGDNPFYMYAIPLDYLRTFHKNAKGGMFHSPLEFCVCVKEE